MGHLISSYKLPGHLSSLGKLLTEFYLLKILDYGPKRHNYFNLVEIRRHLLTAGEAKAMPGLGKGQANGRGNRAQCGAKMGQTFRGDPECLFRSQGPINEPEVNAHPASSILHIPACFRMDLLCREE